MESNETDVKERRMGRLGWLGRFGQKNRVARRAWSNNGEALWTCWKLNTCMLQ